MSEDDRQQLANSLTEMLISCCDFADDRIAKLFTVKSKVMCDYVECDLKIYLPPLWFAARDSAVIIY